MKLDSQGYFITSEGIRFIPVGANYWPGSCGVEMWREWPEDEILSDLDLMVQLGFNTVRFFIRWPDFEPRPGDYDSVSLERLSRFLSACAERGLKAQPSLFVGWMSGGTFWPQWKEDRNLFGDAFVLARSEAYARVLARHLSSFADTLCGIDLGNELNALPEATVAHPKEVREWCRRITEAVRSIIPDVVILSGCDHQQVTADSGWRLGDDTQPGVDVITIHGYPVPNWHPVPLRGLRDSFTQSLLPFYVKCGRAFGPVLLQEFGTILGSAAAAPAQDAYLRGMLTACWNAGANGFLWWCFRDISARVHPYIKNGFERELGLVDSEGMVKPGMRHYVEFINKLVSGEVAVDAGDRDRVTIGLYLPLHYYDRDEPLNPGNFPRETSARLLVAHHLLEQAGFNVVVVRGGHPVPGRVRHLLVAGSALDADEIDSLYRWVEHNGGRLLWHGPDPHGWSGSMERLLGVCIADFASSDPVEADFGGHRYRFSRFPRGTRVEAALREAKVVVRDTLARPLVFSRLLGAGSVTSALADVEGSVLDQWMQPSAFSSWIKWFGEMIERSGTPTADSLKSPDVVEVL